MYSVKTIVYRPALRWLPAIFWQALVTITLLQSSEFPIIGPGHPPGPVDPAWELLLTVAHFVAFSGLVTLIWWGLRPARYALMVALVYCLLFGVATELLQTLVVDRGASVFDLVVDFSASGIAVWIIQRRMRRYEDEIRS